MEKNIDYDYEKKFLDDYMKSLNFFKPTLYKKMYRTGILGNEIGNAFQLNNPEYGLACFYANIALQAVDNFLGKDFLNEDEKSQIKRHPILGAEFLKHKGLIQCADYIYYHHELPDGSGYYKIDNYPKEACYINIADTFEGAITPKNYRPAMTLKEALDLTLSPYRDGIKIGREELKEIEKILVNFYEKMLFTF